LKYLPITGEKQPVWVCYMSADIKPQRNLIMFALLKGKKEKQSSVRGIAAILSAIALTFALVTACDTPTSNSGGGETDVWSNVTHISQVDGSWKAASTGTYIINGVRFTTSTSNYIITFDAAANKMSISGSFTTTLSGINSSTWTEFKTAMQTEYDTYDSDFPTTVTFNDSSYSYTVTGKNTLSSIPAGSLTYFQINQNRTKLKVSEYGSDMYYTKQ
jgi:hypothetical protein